MARTQRPWPIILTFAGIVLIVVLWCGYWFVASGFVRDGFEGELAKLARGGITLDCKARNWGGFPFRFERDCLEPKLTIEGEEAQGEAPAPRDAGLYAEPCHRTDRRPGHLEERPHPHL